MFPGGGPHGPGGDRSPRTPGRAWRLKRPTGRIERALVNNDALSRRWRAARLGPRRGLEDYPRRALEAMGRWRRSGWYSFVGAGDCGKAQIGPAIRVRVRPAAPLCAAIANLTRPYVLGRAAGRPTGLVSSLAKELGGRRRASR